MSMKAFIERAMNGADKTTMENQETDDEKEVEAEADETADEDTEASKEKTAEGDEMPDADDDSDDEKEVEASKEDAASDVKAEKQRMSDIMDCDHAAAFQGTARHLAFKTDLSASAAKEILSAAAEDVVAGVQSSKKLSAKMQAAKSTALGRDAGGSDDEPTTSDRRKAAREKYVNNINQVS